MLVGGTCFFLGVRSMILGETLLFWGGDTVIWGERVINKRTRTVKREDCSPNSPLPLYFTNLKETLVTSWLFLPTKAVNLPASLLNSRFS
jgi:hypothetical protein